MKEIKIIFSNGKKQIKGIYQVKNSQEEDLLVESLGHDLKKGWFIDEVLYLKK